MRSYLKWPAMVTLIIFTVIAIGVQLGQFGNDWATTSDHRLSQPVAGHWFGTNALGQDVFSRTIYSTRSAFILGLCVALLSTLAGAVLGLTAAQFRERWPDTLIQWLAGVLDAIPSYLFIIAMAAAIGASMYGMVLTMSLIFWISTMRLIRAEALRMNTLSFTYAAQALGFSRIRVMFVHILPNIKPTLLYQAMISFITAIKAEVVLSFLGLGHPDQGVSWGYMIAESVSEISLGFYANFLAAGGFLFVFVLALNILTEAYQETSDPRTDQPT